MNNIKEKISSAIDQAKESLSRLSHEIHSNPELSYVEHRASSLLSSVLEEAGLSVTRGAYGLQTAFRATLAGPRPGPRIIICAEYDALPEIGHACGHNLIGAGAVGAAIGLAAVREALHGEVVILGTPAEEGGGGKIKLLQEGAFAGADAAMMYHPLDRDLLANPALASSVVTCTFKGQASHAAAAPWDGVSALSAVLQTFQLIDNARVHFKDGVRVHGIITDGGKAINIIPERAEAQFSVRAPTVLELRQVLRRVQRAARGAAEATGCELQYTEQQGYKNLLNNMTLAERFGTHLKALGREAMRTDPSMGAGSTDMGDVSHEVPSIHPYLAICPKGSAMCHQRTFTAHAGSDEGIEAMLLAAKAMAQTTFDLLTEPNLLQAVKTEHASAM